MECQVFTNHDMKGFIPITSFCLHHTVNAHHAQSCCTGRSVRVLPVSCPELGPQCHTYTPRCVPAWPPILAGLVAVEFGGDFWFCAPQKASILKSHELSSFSQVAPVRSDLTTDKTESHSCRARPQAGTVTCTEQTVPIVLRAFLLHLELRPE